jgi:hypothetical protein
MKEKKKKTKNLTSVKIEVVLLFATGFIFEIIFAYYFFLYKSVLDILFFSLAGVILLLTAIKITTAYIYPQTKTKEQMNRMVKMSRQFQKYIVYVYYILGAISILIAIPVIIYLGKYNLAADGYILLVLGIVFVALGFLFKRIHLY